MGLISLAKYAKKKVSNVYGNGKLEKACVVAYTRSGDRYIIESDDDKINVQFNPSEYSIQRRSSISARRRIGNDFHPRDFQMAGGAPSLLILNLYFDSYSELKSEQGTVDYPYSKVRDYLKSGYNDIKDQSLLKKHMPNWDMNEEYSPNPNHSVNEACETLLGLIKIDPYEHESRVIGFIWGEYLHFVGKVFSYTVQYTVFGRDGLPIRARVSMQIMGEEVSYLNQAQQFPMESPDRTKQRTLHYGDQLWMMAQDEYGEASRWKTIAEANGILNPRVIPGVTRLKVPSIR